MLDYIVAGSAGGLVAIAVYTVAEYLLRPKRVTPNYDRNMNTVSKSVVVEPGLFTRRAMIITLEAQGFHRVYLDGLTDEQIKAHFAVQHLTGKESHVSPQSHSERTHRHR